MVQDRDDIVKKIIGAITKEERAEVTALREKHGDSKHLLNHAAKLAKNPQRRAVARALLKELGFAFSDELAEPEQTVRGVVIALEDNQRLRRALAMVPAIEFYRYQVNFKLVKT